MSPRCVLSFHSMVSSSLAVILQLVSLWLQDGYSSSRHRTLIQMYIKTGREGGLSSCVSLPEKKTFPTTLLEVFPFHLVSRLWAPRLCPGLRGVWEREYLALFSRFVVGDGLCCQGRRGEEWRSASGIGHTLQRWCPSQAVT